MKNKYSLAGIIALGVALGGDSNNHSIEQRILNKEISPEIQQESTFISQQSEQSEHYCNILPRSLTVVPFIVSYNQKGISIDPDNQGNVGLLPEPFDIIFTFNCEEECDERNYPIGMQAFHLYRLQDIDFFTPNERFGEAARYYSAASSPGILLVQGEAERNDQSYQYLGEDNGQMACEVEEQRKRCRVRVESLYEIPNTIDMESLEGETFAVAFASYLGGEGLKLDNIVRNYWVFGNQFTYEY